MPQTVYYSAVVHQTTPKYQSALIPQTLLYNAIHQRITQYQPALMPQTLYSVLVNQTALNLPLSLCLECYNHSQLIY